MTSRTYDYVARTALALVFLISGLGKLIAPAGAMGYMGSKGLPGVLVWPTIALEIGGALLLILGFRIRETAIALGVFTVLTAVIFHTNFADQMQLAAFLKNIAILGGLMLVARASPEASSARP